VGVDQARQLGKQLAFFAHDRGDPPQQQAGDPELEVARIVVEL
jgi:hypothetical protein